MLAACIVPSLNLLRYKQDNFKTIILVQVIIVLVDCNNFVEQSDILRIAGLLPVLAASIKRG